MTEPHVKDRGPKKGCSLGRTEDLREGMPTGEDRGPKGRDAPWGRTEDLREAEPMWQETVLCLNTPLLTGKQSRSEPKLDSNLQRPSPSGLLLFVLNTYCYY